MTAHAWPGWSVGDTPFHAPVSTCGRDAAVLVEIPIAMVLLSRIMRGRANRLANIAAGTFTTISQPLSLIVQAPPPYYLLFSVIEMACTCAIVFYAWKQAGVVHSLSASARAESPSLASP
jgi:hypothetical protein